MASFPTAAPSTATSSALGDHDPVWTAALNAPPSDEPETEEERVAFEQLLVDIGAGRRGSGPEEISALIEEMRRTSGE